MDQNHLCYLLHHPRMGALIVARGPGPVKPNRAPLSASRSAHEDAEATERPIAELGKRNVPEISARMRLGTEVGGYETVTTIGALADRPKVTSPGP